MVNCLVPSAASWYFEFGARPQRLLWASTGTKDPQSVRNALRGCPGGSIHDQYDAGGNLEGFRSAKPQIGKLMQADGGDSEEVSV